MAVATIEKTLCRAQRLSASQRWAFRDASSKAMVPTECSTPFGITEVGIMSARPMQSEQIVLNAFRHHRGGHAGDKIEIRRQTNVLNAFRHHRGGHCLMLSQGSRVRAVLNAFRHHRGGHRNHRPAGCAGSPSAQRLSASQRWACRRSTSLPARPSRAQRLSASQRWALRKVAAGRQR